MKVDQKSIDIPHHYEIFEQDLTKPHLQLKLVGTARTIEEARTCCKLLQEAIMTSASRGLDDLRGKVTFIFRVVLNGDIENDT